MKRIFPKLTVAFTDIQFEDLRNYRVSSKKAKADFKFTPAIAVEEEAKRLKKIFSEGRIQNVNEDNYYNTNYVKALMYNHAI